ncbi:MAG TPA: ABC transporter permease [Mycobacterium sp.]
MTTDAPVRSSLAAESLLFASRLFTHWRRAPTVPTQALLFPTFLLITYKLLVGKSILRITGTDSLYGLVPMCAVAGAMFGALGAALLIPEERDSGLLSQLWVLPVNRASALAGRLLAEAARTLVGAALITAVGVGLGLRFHGGWLAVIPFVLVPVLAVIVFSTAVIAIAVRSKSSAVLFWLAVPSITLVFSSSGIPPVEMLPSWMQPLIPLQPMSPMIESMRALAQGGPALGPLLLSVAWALGLAAVVGPLAVRGYRAAAEAG